jgi:hypothetical protein
MNNKPCNQVPVKFVDCCQVMDCINIDSTDNSVTVEKNGCGVDIRVTGNNLDQIIKLNDGDCISFVKEFNDGVLNFTPILDYDCIAEETCGLCPPVTPAVTCPTPLYLSVN